jgi:acyl-CoA synthetase (AMP-forming)/AMP-acid ligase II
MTLDPGFMQDYALTVDRFLDHGAKWHGGARVVTAGDDAASGAADDVAGYDRVATLAWNTQDHVEVWFAIMGMGAVCHTLNPRLTAEQLAAMIVQSEARVLIVSPTCAAGPQDHGRRAGCRAPAGHRR